MKILEETSDDVERGAKKKGNWVTGQKMVSKKVQVL